MANNEDQALQTDLAKAMEQVKLNDDDIKALEAELNRIKQQIEKKHKKAEKLNKQVDIVNGRIAKRLQYKLNVVLDSIKLKNEEKCNKILSAVFPKVVQKMCEANCLFKKMYKHPVYTGSFYEKLRIKDACEFDINLALELPLKYKFIKMEPCKNPASHARLSLQKKVDELGLTDKEAKGMLSILDNNLNVLPEKVLSWTQKVMDDAKLKDIKVEEVEKIHFTASGPARTLEIFLDDDEKTMISVDLVPVFKFPFTEWPEQLKGLRKSEVKDTNYQKRNLFLVPKTYKPGVLKNSPEPDKNEVSVMWRMNLPEVEKNVLESRLESRPVIKLLKLLRDSEKWNCLHSYFLKTLVLNEIAANPEKDWTQNSIAERLFEMMERLQTSLKNKILPHFFFTSVNLFHYITVAEMGKMSNRLTKVMKIREDPSLVEKFFVVQT